jgi:hypothetical protein
VKRPTSYDELVAQLEPLDERELLAVAGLATLSPGEHALAALDQYAPENIADEIDVEALFGAGRAVDLVARGRDAVSRAVEARRDQLRRQVCPKWEKASERELVLDIAPIISDEVLRQVVHAGEPTAAVIAGAIIIVRYLLAKLCEEA